MWQMQSSAVALINCAALHIPTNGSFSGYGQVFWAVQHIFLKLYVKGSEKNILL